MSKCATGRVVRVAALAALAACTLTLSACKWTAHTWLMPVASYDDPPPIPVGAYVEANQSGTTHEVSAIPANTKVLHIVVRGPSGPDAEYNTGYDRIGGDYYLVEVYQPNSGERMFLILRTRANGYDYWQPACATNIDSAIALSAGAVLETSSNDPNSSDCVFSSYPSLLQAARGIVTSIQSGTYAGQMTSFTRSGLL